MEWYWIVLIVIGSLAVWFALSAIFYKQFFKRFYDLTLSLFALIVLSPLLLVLTIVGAIVMKGNPFFVQPRPGKIDPKTGKEKIFKMIKFRTMSNEKDKNGNLLPDEQRLNSWGKLERSLSIDELGSLITIAAGHMSIVGPRPLLVRDMVFMTSEQRRRHCIRPGLTGFAQVNGRNNISWEQKLQYDIEYVDHGVTLINDIKIVLQTVIKVFKRSDVVREGTESDIDFGDWLLNNGEISAEEYQKKQLEAKELLKI